MDIKLKDLFGTINPNTILVVQDEVDGILWAKTGRKIEETPLYKQVYVDYTVLEIRPEDFGNGITYLFIEITKE